VARTVSEARQDSALALAEAAYELVQADAADAAELARRALELARTQRQPEAEVAALHALAFAWHELGDPRALRTTRAAIRIGERHGLARRTALVRRRLALDLAGRGDFSGALRELDIACAALDPHELARTEVFRIAVLLYAGSRDDPLAGVDPALETLRRKRDTIWEARLLRNRGLLQAERGNSGAAERDLLRARDLYAGLGAGAAAVGAEIQLARIALAGGDLPACLARLDAIDAANLPATDQSELELLRAQTLGACRLMAEALQSLGVAQSIWERAGRNDHEGRFELIRLSLLAGDPQGAYAHARKTQRAFAAQRRHVHAARAAGLALTASIAAGTVRPSTLRSGRRATVTLAAAGWQQEAIRVQLAVARAAIELGSARVARIELARCAQLRRRGPLADRVEAWHVEALIKQTEGDADGAQRAASQGRRVLEHHRAALGASELRATASEIGAELACVGLRIALGSDDLGALFAWAENLRGSALRLVPVTPPTNPELRTAMTELRRVSGELDRAQVGGHAVRELLARQARFEAQVRQLSRHAPAGPGPAGPAPDSRATARATPAVGELTSALGGGGLIEFVELDGHMTALTLAGGRLTRHDLGALAPIAEQLAWLRFSLTRLARLRARAPQRAALLAGAHASAQALDTRVIAPLATAMGESELVIVPTGSLHSLPWAMLPTLTGRPLTVSPSAAVWLALKARRPRRRRRAVLAAGPRLRHAVAEVRRLQELYPGATVLTGADATVANVLRAADGAGVVHLSCHGRFRADSPLFSSLELADGPAIAYELQRLRRPPELIVLSACDLAVSDARSGDELLGFAAALLDMGTRTVIASVIPAPDAGARRLMLRLHSRLTSGAQPAVALARAQASLPSQESALAGFICLGAG
jgi:CHAT domain